MVHLCLQLISQGRHLYCRAVNNPAPEALHSLDPARLPQHVAIIMDGNGRWARSQGKPRIEGHRKGVEVVRQIVDCAGDIGLKYLTLYAFSAENWQRPDTEVKALMNLLEIFLKRYTPEMLEHGIRLRTIGDISVLPQRVRKSLYHTLEVTQSFNERHLILALNYGARQEMVHAVRQFAREVHAGEADPESLDWATLARYLYTADIPDPDLMIRTSGEMRLSNYLLMQSAYAEFVFSSVPWPEFSPAIFIDAIHDYQKRERRFGLTGDQLRRTELPDPAHTSA